MKKVSFRRALKEVREEASCSSKQQGWRHQREQEQFRWWTELRVWQGHWQKPDRRLERRGLSGVKLYSNYFVVKYNKKKSTHLFLTSISGFHYSQFMTHLC